jgi:hypothetical protein
MWRRWRRIKLAAASAEEEQTTMIEAALAAIDWQNLMALAIVFAALASLARRAYELFTDKSPQGCASACSGCSGSANAAPALVQLELHGTRSGQ